MDLLLCRSPTYANRCSFMRDRRWLESFHLFGRETRGYEETIFGRQLTTIRRAAVRSAAVVTETAQPHVGGEAARPRLHRFLAAPVVGGRGGAVPHRGCLRLLAASGETTRGPTAEREHESVTISCSAAPAPTAPVALLRTFPASVPSCRTSGNEPCSHLRPVR
jgi:hypothetical protein